MQDRTPKYPGRVLLTPEDGSAPFYATMERADEPTQVGDPLNKATFLADDTAAMFGFGNDAVPNDILVAIKNIIDNKSAFYAGSYVGTGEYGEDNPTTVPVGFDPDFVVISKAEREMAFSGFIDTAFKESFLFWQSGVTKDRVLYGGSNNVIYRHYSHGDTGLSMWISGTGTLTPSVQFNDEGVTYYYIAGRYALDAV